MMMMMMIMMTLQMSRQWTEMRRLALSLREPSTSAGGRSRLKQLLFRFVIVIVIVIVIVNNIKFSDRVWLWPFLLEAFNTSPSLSSS